MRRGEQGVLHEPRGLAKPPHARLVHDLALERNRGEVPVKSALSVRRHGDDLIVQLVQIPHFALNTHSTTGLSRGGKRGMVRFRGAKNDRKQRKRKGGQRGFKQRPFSSWGLTARLTPLRRVVSDKQLPSMFRIDRSISSHLTKDDSSCALAAATRTRLGAVVRDLELATIALAARDRPAPLPHTLVDAAMLDLLPPLFCPPADDVDPSCQQEEGKMPKRWSRGQLRDRACCWRRARRGGGGGGGGGGRDFA